MKTEYDSNKIIQEIYSLESQGKSKDAAIYIVEQFFVLRENDIQIISKVFDDIDFKKLSSWSIVSLLRSTFVYKDKLERWIPLTIYAKSYFSSIGLESKSNLHGLI